MGASGAESFGGWGGLINTRVFPPSLPPSSHSPCHRLAAPASSHKAGDREADVYVVDDGDEEGIWDVNFQDLILDPTYGTVPTEFTAHTLNIEVQDVPGVLNQVRWMAVRARQKCKVWKCERKGHHVRDMELNVSPLASSIIIRSRGALHGGVTASRAWPLVPVSGRACPAYAWSSPAPRSPFQSC